MSRATTVAVAPPVDASIPETPAANGPVPGLHLNLGCGHRKLAGFVNVDHFGGCAPDVVADLETFPWPFDDDSVAEIVMSHVLEHLGRDTATYLGVIRELYRICRHGARLLIIVPHPRHDEYLVDPTHVRPIVPESFQMLSVRKNEEWIARGAANTPLAIQIGVDFEIERVAYDLDPVWKQKRQRGELDAAELAHAIASYANVVRQVEVLLRVRKPGSAPDPTP